RHAARDRRRAAGAHVRFGRHLLCPLRDGRRARYGACTDSAYSSGLVAACQPPEGLMARSVTDSVQFVDGGADHRLLLIADHASNQVPSEIELGISDALLSDHIAVDIGAGPLARALARRLDCPAIMGAWSRL